MLDFTSALAKATVTRRLTTYTLDLQRLSDAKVVHVLHQQHPLDSTCGAQGAFQANTASAMSIPPILPKSQFHTPHINPCPPSSSLAPSDPNSAIRVYITDLTGIPACRAFAENLLEHLHGAEAEPVRNLDEVLQSRRSTRFPYYGLHSAFPLIPFRLDSPFHPESLVFHLKRSPPASNSINPPLL
ncbi:hypothetical protein K443DRAFT_11205 [Laccaria amethystina LaAM-08-1]|uniref:Unplaced genomic scaffold K443scaffold_211, whole genome shotgun sequence n=1 Tax=Laccaria amethystina LaAM-08-1 TaxID=1095629 RepID=A0A0C9WK24_9AGAR|nr:hypothetical protein K443DRAFT_11205 [Laccaria amethystina LaAM-08-1]